MREMPTTDKKPARAIVTRDGHAHGQVTVEAQGESETTLPPAEHPINVCFTLRRFSHPELPYWTPEGWRATKSSHTLGPLSPASVHPRLRLTIDGSRIDPGPHRLSWHINDAAECFVDFDWPVVPTLTVKAKVEEKKNDGPQDDVISKPNGRRWKVYSLAVIALFAVMIVVGVLVFRLTSPPPVRPQTEPPPPPPVDGCTNIRELSALEKVVDGFQNGHDRVGAARIAALMANRCPSRYAALAAALFEPLPGTLDGQGDDDCASYYRALADKTPIDKKTCRYAQPTTPRKPESREKEK